MNILVVGLGSIAQRHIQNLRQIVPDARIAIWRQHAKSRENLPLGVVDCFFSWSEVVDFKPDVALITNPASYHVESALRLAELQVHLFIEKPLSDRIQDVDRLIAICQKRSLTLMVGYGFRFYEPLLAIKKILHEGLIGKLVSFRAEVGQYLPDWRKGRDYRDSVSAQRSLGGGAVLELSHELDYARWLMGDVERVGAMVGQVGNLELDVEDVAEIILYFKNGAIGNIHLDMLQRDPVRLCRVVGTLGTVVWDGLKHRVRLFLASQGCWEDLCVQEGLDFNTVYQAELRHFLDCVQTGTAPRVTGLDGKETLLLALATKQASLEGQVVDL